MDRSLKNNKTNKHEQYLPYFSLVTCGTEKDNQVKLQ